MTALVYVRRSNKPTGSADVSDEVQEATARSLLPPDVAVEVIRDSGGHHSGATDARDGYQRLLARVRSGTVTHIAVYDLSRLARNATLMLNLRDELDRRNVTLLAGNLPATRSDSASGRFMFAMLCSAAQFQRDVDSERMRALARSQFEAGQHRGNDPFGYRSARTASGRLEHPRRLVIVEAEAEVVRRVWRDLATKPTRRIAADLNAEGVPRRDAETWTKDSVKDIQRRGRHYLGFAVAKRGLDEAQGTHEAILTEAEYQAGMLGSARRFREGLRPKPWRAYALKGVLVCGACQRPMHGLTRTSRGKEWRYYACRTCDAPSVPLHEAETAVLDAIRALRLPKAAIDRARAILLERMNIPSGEAAGGQRKRLETRLARLRQMYSWQQMPESEYQEAVRETQRMLAALPSEDRIVLFDRHRKVIESMDEAIDKASPVQRAELVRLLVERVEAHDRTVSVPTLEWVGSVRPFFERVDVVEERPRTATGAHLGDDALAWYAEAFA